MNTTNNPMLKDEKSITQQSDIVIDPTGRIYISFLWDDLRDVPAQVSGFPNVSESIPPHENDWAIPVIKENFKHLNEFLNCQLCPKKCGFNRLEKTHPTCGDYQLRVATSGITFGDEPEIRGSRGSGAIMLSGCPLKCPSCHNPEKVAHGAVTSIESFVKLCRDLLLKGAHNIQILSPTVHLPSLITALKVLKGNSLPIPIILKSSGYEAVDQLQRLSGLVDIYLPDFKFGSCSQWARRAGVRDYFEKSKLGIAEMIRQVGPVQFDSEGVLKRGVLVRHVESPLPFEEKEQIRSFLDNLPAGVLVSRQSNFVMLE